jgi:hypothetical protein
MWVLGKEGVHYLSSPLATSHLCETGFSAVAAVRTMNVGNVRRAADTKVRRNMMSSVLRDNHICLTNPGIKWPAFK